jgi:hypothetical protein
VYQSFEIFVGHANQFAVGAGIEGNLFVRGQAFLDKNL